MSLPATTVFSNPNPLWNPQNFQQLINYLNMLVATTISGTYKPYVVGNPTPITGDQDKVWLKVDSNGRPVGTFIYYSGHWRRTATGLTSELRYFTGNPATYFDGSGLGLVDTDWDGWALCNGANGTPNLSDKFLIPGKMDDSSGYDEGGAKWTSKVSGVNLQSGGVKDFSLTLALTPRPARAAVSVGLATADGNGPAVSGPLYGSNASAETAILLAADVGVAGPTTIPTLPPYYACAIAMWKGYP